MPKLPAQLKVPDKLEAAFLNNMKAQGVEIPSPGIRVIQMDKPFIISIEDNDALQKVKKALEDCKKIKKDVTFGNLEKAIQEGLRKHLASPK